MTETLLAALAERAADGLCKPASSDTISQCGFDDVLPLLVDVLSPAKLLECTAVSKTAASQLGADDLWCALHAQAFGFDDVPVLTALAPRHRYALALHAICSEALGLLASKQWELAWRTVERVLKLDPTWCRGWEGLIFSLRHLGYWEEAELRAVMAVEACACVSDQRVHSRLASAKAAAARDREQWSQAFSALQAYLLELEVDEASADQIVNVAGVALPRAVSPPRLCLRRRLLPMWEEYPQPRYAMGAIGWRMGEGEAFKSHWRRGFEALSVAQRRRYQEMFPEHKSWSGFYERLCYDLHLREVSRFARAAEIM